MVVNQRSYTVSCACCDGATECSITSEGSEYNGAGLGPGDFANYPHNSSDFPVLKQRDDYPDWPTGNGTVCYELWVYKDVTHNGSTYDVSGATSEQRIRTPGRKLNRVDAGDRDAYDAPHDTTWNHTTDTGSGTDVADSLYFDGVSGGFVGGHEQESASVDYTLTSTNLSDIYTVVDTDYGANGPASGAEHTLILYVRRHGVAGGPYTDTAGDIFLQAAHVVCPSVPVPSTCPYTTSSKTIRVQYDWEQFNSTACTGSPDLSGSVDATVTNGVGPCEWFVANIGDDGGGTGIDTNVLLETDLLRWVFYWPSVGAPIFTIKDTGDTVEGVYVSEGCVDIGGGTYFRITNMVVS